MMEEPEWRPKTVENLDVEDLLNNGYWKTSRKSSSNTASPTFQSPRTSFLGTSTPTTHLRPRYYSRSDWPPSPSVEDETESLAREVTSNSSPAISVDEPPCRGEFEQHPIILEADDSGYVSNKEAPQSANSERRFVLQSHTSSESEDEKSTEEHTQKRDNHRLRRENSDGKKKHDDHKLGDKTVPLERKKSHQDLPNLNTKIESPPFRRSSSAYSFIPPKQEARHSARTPDVSSRKESGYFTRTPDILHRESKHVRTPKAEAFLSPGTGRGQTAGYFDIVGSRHSSRSEQSTPRPRTPADNPKSPSETTRRQDPPRSPGSRPEVNEIRRERSGHHTGSEDDRKVKHRHHHRHKSSTLHPDQGRDNGRESDRHHRSHSKSRYTSTLPSPRSSPNRYDTYPPARGPISSDSDFSESPESARLKPLGIWDRPSRKPSPVPGVDYEYVESIPPEVKTPAPERQSPTQPSYWQPPERDERQPIGSYRRYSEDLENGIIPTLPQCPRADFVKGYNDWITIPGCPSFDICPSCFNYSIADTPYRYQFVPAPPRPKDNAIVCDFGSSIWHRIAWLIILKESLPDIKLLSKTSDVLSKTPQCSETHHTKQWFSIPDPTTGKPIANFEVCGACVASINSLLPSFRGIFTRIDNPHPKLCSMRFDGKKFTEYFDAFETTADLGVAANMGALTARIKDIARRPECQRDTMLFGEWHSITQLPDFTACQECFDEVVRPLQGRRKAIALMVGRREREWGACMLYSERMRRIFRECVESDNYGMLVKAVRERRAIEDSYRGNLAAGRKGLEKEWRRWE